jgi:hypothetical protein
MSIGDSILTALNPLTPWADAQDVINTAQGIYDDKSKDLGAPVKFYENWGGPGWGGHKPPADGLDRAFMNHDNAYGARGYLDTAADVNYTTASALNALDPDASHRERLYGGIAAGIFAGLVPVTSTFTSVINPIAKADTPIEAVVNLATAPITTAAAVVTGTVEAVGNFLGGLFDW